MSSSSGDHQPVQAKLGLVDAISIIVGIVIGSTIFLTPPEIFHDVGNHWVALGLWGVGGLLALIGALCYAELATAYPRLGGDYNYLTRAYGPFMGYLFGWAQLAVVQTASVGMMASIFADYTVGLAGRTNWWTPESYSLGGINFSPSILYAVAAVVLLTMLNMLGVVLGKAAQNLLSLIKIVGLLAIIVTGFAFARWPAAEEQPDMFIGKVVSASPAKFVVGELGIVSAAPGKLVVRELDGEKERTFVISDKTRVTINRSDGGEPKNTIEHLQQDQTEKARKDKEQIVKVFTRKGAAEADAAVQVKTTNVFDWGRFWDSLLILLAAGGPMITIMLAYGGWNDAAFVAAEVRNRERNLPRALLWATALIVVIYLLVNGAYLFSLGPERAEESGQIAADVLGLLPGDAGQYGAVIMSLLVMIAALGAVNGLIYTSSRIYSTLGSDYSLLAPLGQWSRGLGTPIWSLLLQMLITASMLVMVGTTEGRDLLNKGLEGLNLQRVTQWYIGGFFPLLKCSAPIFWLFFLMSGLSLFVLRINEPHVDRPFRVPLFPVVPLLFCVSCGYMLYSGINFAGQLGVVGAGLVLLGIPFYVFSRRGGGTDATADLSATPVVPSRKNF